MNAFIIAGVGLLLFGIVLLWMYRSTFGRSAKLISATAKIVGYKQFPADQLITDNTISRGASTWMRVVEFTDQESGQKIQMCSNPAVPNPEPIGTELTIFYNPQKTDKIKDFAMIKE